VCSSDACRARRRELELNLKAARAETKAAEDRLWQAEREMEVRLESMRVFVP
jgi:hypothetical protein